ncbi:MAG: BMP family protein [Candidatus Thorarchaeota archaeon]
MSSRSHMIISIIIIAIVFGSVGAMILIANPYEPSRIAVVVMEPGFGDMSKADTALEGMEQLAGDVSVQYYIPPQLPTSVPEARSIMESLATTGLYDLILAIGADLAPAVQTVATSFPNQKFGMIGADVALDNVASAIYAVEESAFLGGVVAAFMAHEMPYYGDEPFDGEIGILAAVEGDTELLPLINGFIQGVEAANSTYNLNVTLTEINYINSWNNTINAELQTYTMFAIHGISVIFAPVRASMPGVREGMLRAADSFPPSQLVAGRMPLVIAAEGNQDYFGTNNPDIPVAPSWITTSVLSGTAEAIYDIINKTLWNVFPANEVLEYDLTNGGVNITDFPYSSTYLPAELYEALDYYREWIRTNPGVITIDSPVPP